MSPISSEMDRKKKLLEICVDSVESALIAAGNGADRLELCSALSVGGLTPSAVKKKIGEKIPIFCMIRPRPGHFSYSPEEFEVMKMDLEFLKGAGADGFVFGCLNEFDSVDENVVQLLEMADPLPCTFHRAFDLVADPFETLEILIKFGFKRILTSGQKISAPEGLKLLKQLQEKADGRIIIMAGAGIRSTNVKQILEGCDVSEIHTSASMVTFNPSEKPKKISDFDSVLKLCSSFEIQAIKNVLNSN